MTTTLKNIDELQAKLAACAAEQKALAEKLEELQGFREAELAVEAGRACWDCLKASAKHPQQTAQCGCTWADALCDACDAKHRSVACDDCQRDAYSEEDDAAALRDQHDFECEHSASRLG